VFPFIPFDKLDTSRPLAGHCHILWEMLLQLFVAHCTLTIFASLLLLIIVGKADIDACYDIDINDSADDTAIQETSIYFVFVESGSIGICIRIVLIEK